MSSGGLKDLMVNQMEKLVDADKLKEQEELITELRKQRDYWYDSYVDALMRLYACAPDKFMHPE